MEKLSEARIQSYIDQKTKPKGSLGRLEDLALQICKVQNSLQPRINNPQLLVFAASHGIAAEKVSAYPSEVTAQMVLNFLAGGAAINVFCRQNDLALNIIDCGVAESLPEHPKLHSLKVARGTKNMLYGPAMAAEELDRCFQQAAELVEKKATEGCNLMAFGEMGIGNTTASGLIMHQLSGLPLENCIGKGTGLSDEGWKEKLAICQQILERNGPRKDPKEALAYYGGFEIAHICAAMLEAHSKNMLLLVDGFIASVAYLAAYSIRPAIQSHAVFCHQSNEKGHVHLLKHLKAQALLHLNMRLGEGTGCALALPLIRGALAFLNEMADFDSAGVSKNC